MRTFVASAPSRGRSAPPPASVKIVPSAAAAGVAPPRATATHHVAKPHLRPRTVNAPPWAAREHPAAGLGAHPEGGHRLDPRETCRPAYDLVGFEAAWSDNRRSAPLSDLEDPPRVVAPATTG